MAKKATVYIEEDDWVYEFSAHLHHWHLSSHWMLNPVLTLWWDETPTEDSYPPRKKAPAVLDMPDVGEFYD